MPYFGAKAGSYVDIFMDCIRWRSVERGYEELSHV